HQVPFFDPAQFPGLGKGNGNGGGRGVSVLHDVVVHLIVGKPKFFLDELGNPEIGLVGNEQIDIPFVQLVGLQTFHDDLAEADHGVFEHKLSVHIGIVRSVLGIGIPEDVGHPTFAHTGGDQGKFLGMLPFRMQVGGDYALGRVLFPAQYGRSRPIAKNHGYAPAPGAHVQAVGMQFGADHQHLSVHAALDVLVRHGKGIDKAGTLVPDIQGPHGAKAHVPLYQVPRTWKVIVRAQGGEHDEIDFFLVDPRPLYGYFAGLDPHGGGGVRSLDHMPPFPDTRPFLDPLVVGVHEFGQIVIGDHIIWDIEPQSDYLGIVHVAVFFMLLWIAN